VPPVRCRRLPRSWPRSCLLIRLPPGKGRSRRSPRPAASLASEELLRRGDDPCWIEAKLSLQFPKMCGSAEGFDANDLAGGTYIAVPSENRSLLHGDTRPPPRFNPSGLWLHYAIIAGIVRPHQRLVEEAFHRVGCGIAQCCVHLILAHSAQAWITTLVERILRKPRVSLHG